MLDASSHTRKPALPLMGAVAAATTVMVVAAVSFASSARAAGPPDVLLGTSAQFAVLASAGITKTGPITVDGDVGSAPQGITGTGTITYSAGVERGAADGVVANAKADLLIAYGQAAGAQTSTTALPPDIGGLTLTGGTYNRAASLDFTGDLTLDGENDPNSVFIIQVGTSLTTASSAKVLLTRGAQACHVYWQVAQDTTIQTDAQFKGNILAGNSITAATRATFEGRLLTNNGAVTLDSNRITLPVCATATTPAPTATTPAPTASPTKKPTPKPTKKSPSRSGGGGNASDSDDSDTDGGGGSGGGGGSSDSDTGGGGGAGGGDTDTTSTTSTPGLPDTGGPPKYLAPLGGVAVLAGLGLVFVARTRKGMHRS